MMFYNPFSFGFFGIGFFGMIFMVALWALFIWLIVWLVKKYTKEQQGCSSNPDDGPLLILKRRYAGGEISKKEYEEMKKDLAK